jgi:cytochrome c oxidase subunit IV
MSTHAHTTGGDHHPHVLPLRTYLLTWGALLVFTVITVGASYLDLGHAGNLFVALAIATTKALLVAAIFMHLRYDLRFHSVILGSSLIFLTIFISFTMFDTQARGRAEGVESERPGNIKTPFAVATAAAVPTAGANASAGTIVPTAVPANGPAAVGPNGTAANGVSAIPNPNGSSAGNPPATGPTASVAPGAPANATVVAPKVAAPPSEPANSKAGQPAHL